MFFRGFSGSREEKVGLYPRHRLSAPRGTLESFYGDNRGREGGLCARVLFQGRSHPLARFSPRWRIDETTQKAGPLETDSSRAPVHAISKGRFPGSWEGRTSDSTYAKRRANGDKVIQTGFALCGDEVPDAAFLLGTGVDAYRRCSRSPLHRFGAWRLFRGVFPFPLD